MKPKMSEDKHVEQPTFVINTPQMTEEKKVGGRLTKKHVLIAAISLLIAVVIVIGVIVSIRIYADSNVEVLKYKLKLKDKDNNDVEQDVSTDDNSVVYHVVKNGVEAWILQDFDKNVEVSKVKTEDGVSCFLSALNRSNAQEPQLIPSTAPTTGKDTPSTQLVYKVSENPVKDISFLGKRATKLCSNIPTYWMVPSCKNGAEPSTNTSLSTSDGRSKRATICSTCIGYQCVCGCCWAVCGRFASSQYTWYYSNGHYYCRYYMYSVVCEVNLASNNCYVGNQRYYYPWS